MSNGIRIRDTDGNVILDITDRITRILGVIAVSSPGSLYHADLSSGTPWAVILDPNGNVAANSQPMVPRFPGNNTMVWEAWQAGVPGRFTHIMYGLY